MCRKAYFYVFAAERSACGDDAGRGPSAPAYDVQSGSDAAEAGVYGCGRVWGPELEAVLWEAVGDGVFGAVDGESQEQIVGDILEEDWQGVEVVVQKVC